MSKETNESNTALIAEFFQRILSFGKSTVSTFEDEADKLIKRLVEKGQMTEEEARRIVDDVKKKARWDRDDLLGLFDASLKRTLGALNIPSRGDVSELQAKIDELTRRLDELVENGGGEDG